MNYISDPIRLVGRIVTVHTTGGDTATGTLCSAGLGGVLLDIDGHRLELAASEVHGLEAETEAQRPVSDSQSTALDV